MSLMMKSITLPDGRAADVLLGGDPAGDPLVMHHGTPGDSTIFTDWHASCEKRGIRLICASRPGYATSTRKAGRSVAQVASDISAILDTLGHRQFMTVGWSGGGPHALACAAMLPDRCVAAATLASIAPFDAANLDFFDGMDDSGSAEFRIAQNGEATLSKWVHGQAGRAIGDLIAGIDSAETVAAVFHRALEHGLTGWIDDDLAFTAQWGFDPGNIKAPVTVWQGELDSSVPPAHGHWLVNHIRGAVGRMLPEHGHFFPLIVRYRDEVLEVLRGRLASA